MISFTKERVELTNMLNADEKEWALIAGAAAFAGYGAIRSNEHEKLLRLMNVDEGDRYTPYRQDMAMWMRVLAGKDQVKPHPRADEAARRAEEMFGTTNSLSLAGFIDTNGKFLSFSYQGYMRDIDHREIHFIFDDMGIPYDNEMWKALVLFMDMGNIRLLGNGSFDLSACPNERQWGPLNRYMNYFGKELYVDLSARESGLHIATMEYPVYGTWSVKDDLIRFFKTGQLPENII